MQNSHPLTGGYFRVYLLSAVNQEDFSRKFKQSFFLCPLTRGGEIPMFARYARVFQQPSSATISLFLPHKVVHLARIFASASFIAVVHFLLILERISSPRFMHFACIFAGAISHLRHAFRTHF